MPQKNCPLSELLFVKQVHTEKSTGIINITEHDIILYVIDQFNAALTIDDLYQTAYSSKTESSSFDAIIPLASDSIVIRTGEL